MDYVTRFSGISSLCGESQLEILNKSHVMIVGLGGVGTWVVESLARSGVGELTLVDLDDICVSNTNRQIHANLGSYGEFKAEALEKRIKLINPECRVNVELSYFSSKNQNKLLGMGPDVVVDCIDSVREKVLLITECKRRSISLVVTGAAGGKYDPTKIQATDLSKSINDRLLKRTKKVLRQEHRFPLGRNGGRVKCVFSSEIQKKSETCSAESSSTNLKLDCDGGLGSVTHVTGTFGFFAAYLVMEELLSQE